MMAVTGDDCTDIDDTLGAGDGINTAMYAVDHASQGIADLSK